MFSKPARINQLTSPQSETENFINIQLSDNFFQRRFFWRRRKKLKFSLPFTKCTTSPYLLIGANYQSMLCVVARASYYLFFEEKKTFFFLFFTFTNPFITSFSSSSTLAHTFYSHRWLLKSSIKHVLTMTIWQRLFVKFQFSKLFITLTLHDYMR